MAQLTLTARYQTKLTLFCVKSISGEYIKLIGRSVKIVKTNSFTKELIFKITFFLSIL